jgi:hypothetical protein
MQKADSQKAQDGMTAQEWLQRMFESEYCDYCGLDVEDHTATMFLGNFFAYCHNGPDAIGERAWRSRYRKLHGKYPEADGE